VPKEALLPTAFSIWATGSVRKRYAGRFHVSSGA
jgi:hypothetical protein